MKTKYFFSLFVLIGLCSCSILQKRAPSSTSKSELIEDLKDFVANRIEINEWESFFYQFRSLSEDDVVAVTQKVLPLEDVIAGKRHNSVTNFCWWNCRLRKSQIY